MVCYKILLPYKIIPDFFAQLTSDARYFVVDLLMDPSVDLLQNSVHQTLPSTRWAS